MKSVVYCDLCGGQALEPLFSTRDRMHGIAGEFVLKRCRQCSLAMTTPQPEGAELAQYYPSDAYYSLSAISDQPNRLKLFSDFLYRVFFGRRHRLPQVLFIGFRPLLRTIIVVPGGRFLDVGCGSGDFMAKVRTFGMEVWGVEPGGFDELSAQRHHLRIHHGDIFSAHFPDKYFDVISLNHVFEHVPNPTDVLQELGRILKPGGRIVIAVPNIDSLAFRMFRQRWVNLDAPRHLFDFSARTLRAYGQKVGLRVDRMRYISNSFQFVGSLLYVLNDRRGNNRSLHDSDWIRRMYNGYSVWLNALVNAPLLPLAYLLNWLHQGDVVEVTYRKPE